MAMATKEERKKWGQYEKAVQKFCEHKTPGRNLIGEIMEKGVLLTGLAPAVLNLWASLQPPTCA